MQDRAICCILFLRTTRELNVWHEQSRRPLWLCLAPTCKLSALIILAKCFGKKLDLFIYIKICIHLFVCMSMTLSGSDLQGDCPDHTQTYCYGCKSTYTQCKSAQVHTVQAHKHRSTHSASSARHVLHISHTALITHCLAGTCTSSLFELLFTGALLFKATLCWAFHWIYTLLYFSLHLAWLFTEAGRGRCPCPGAAAALWLHLDHNGQDRDSAQSLILLCKPCNRAACTTHIYTYTKYKHKRTHI